MDPVEQTIMKRVRYWLGYEPTGMLDLLHILAHPDLVDLTITYLEEKRSQDQQGL